MIKELEAKEAYIKQLEETIQGLIKEKDEAWNIANYFQTKDERSSHSSFDIYIVNLKKKLCVHRQLSPYNIKFILKILKKNDSLQVKQKEIMKFLKREDMYEKQLYQKANVEDFKSKYSSTIQVNIIRTNRNRLGEYKIINSTSLILYFDIDSLKVTNIIKKYDQPR